MTDYNVTALFATACDRVNPSGFVTCFNIECSKSTIFFVCMCVTSSVYVQSVHTLHATSVNQEYFSVQLN